MCKASEIAVECIFNFFISEKGLSHLNSEVVWQNKVKILFVAGGAAEDIPLVDGHYVEVTR